MWKRLNGWAPWIGVLVTLLTNLVAITMFMSRLDVSVKHLESMLQKSEQREEKLASKIDDVDKRVTSVDATLATHMKYDKPG